MARAMARLRCGERGMTLVELLVAMAIMGLVGVVFTSVLASVQRRVVDQEYLDRNNEQARLAIQQLDREIRSGNVLYDPALETPANYRLRIYTQTNADTRDPAPGYLCVLWELTEDGVLRTRWWPPGEPGQASDWRVVAEGIVNRDLGQPAFSLDPDPNKGGRTIHVELHVNADLDGRGFATTTVESSLTGRNTSYGFPQDVCATLPS